ncbi:Alkaline phosphatase H [Seminavis robusta]|uniref:alkaline phosphatase n=1 Tax=Seminavis robusta TaxID=568900 RepID=A0A9N8D6Z3_9STRA|nr:Alkaline phosphatase H [Seminavis robusta]|eukprot:Sro17_g012100.1 Alkaline phosphatase H (693) ;mRNA; r:29328-31863
MKIQLALPVLSLLAAPVVVEGSFWQGLRRRVQFDDPPQEVSEDGPPPRTCNPSGMSNYAFLGKDNSERLLLREGVIDSIPSTLCGRNNSKNVILVVGDGMGWEMNRAGAIAKRVVQELESLGCDTKVGCPDNTAAMEAFAGRTLQDYYTEGKGSGLSYQELEGFALVTTTTTVIQAPTDGAHYAPTHSLINGSTADHDNGLGPLALNKCGFAIDFDPADYVIDGGNMVLWNDVLGGKNPWEERYFQENPDTSDGFDPTYIMQHATDSASTAGTYATGHKAAVGMMSVDLYEQDVNTILEDAMACQKAGGVVTSVPVLHATPGAFVTHSNNRKNRDQLRRTFQKVAPTLASGVCGGDYYPYPEDLQSMRNGSLSSSWTFFEQQEGVLAEDFYNGLRDLDPDNGDHVMVCVGGDFSASGEDNMPYRGLDSTYSNRWCSAGIVETDDTDPNNTIPIGVTPNSTICNHYEPEEVAQIPTITEHVQAALDFLSKDDDGFFLMYEQGDVDWAAHANHMDDMLGTMLDIDEAVQAIMNFIQANGGWEKNALYVTADHDHYLTLLPEFPERVAQNLIMGTSHDMTPENNSNKNPWTEAINAGRHSDDSKTQGEHIGDFTTWTPDDVENVGHFWGLRESGGNGWGSHSTRPVPLFYQGDDGCVEALMGAGYQVVGREVPGVEDKIDQVHVHACMLKNLFGL